LEFVIGSLAVVYGLLLKNRNDARSKRYDSRKTKGIKYIVVASVQCRADAGVH
jgi:hypothetical protein